MSYEAIAWGLRLKPDKGKWFYFAPNQSMKWFWGWVEYIPVKRLTYGGESPTSERS
jgi:hypothetical protein